MTKWHWIGAGLLAVARLGYMMPDSPVTQWCKANVDREHALHLREPCSTDLVLYPHCLFLETTAECQVMAKARGVTLNADTRDALEGFVADAGRLPASGIGDDSNAEGRRRGDTRGRSLC